MVQITSAIMDQEMGGSPFSILRRHFCRENGVPVLKREEVIQACGTIHPAAAADLQLFPEEYRSETVIHIHSAVRLSTGSSADLLHYTAPDLILLGGRKYLVFSVKDWSAFGFCKAFAVLQREVEN